MLDYKDVFCLNHCIPDKESDLATKIYDTAGNMGNAYIMYCISKILFGQYIDRSQIHGIPNLFQTNLEYIDTRYINKNYKYVLINMQDQLKSGISYFPHLTDIAFSRINRLLKKIKLPLLCYGLGSNYPNPERQFGDSIVDDLYDSQKDFVKLVSEKSSVFSIRGTFTKQLMDDLNIKNYATVGCPSFYVNPTRHIKTPKYPKKIVFTGHQPFLQSTFNLEYSIDPQTNVLTQVVSPWARFWNEGEPTKGKSVELFYLCQDSTELQLITSMANLPEQKVNGIKIAYLTDIEEINNFFQDKDLVMGNRMHGCIMALNNNVPGMVIDSDARAGEMCNLFGIPMFRHDILRNPAHNETLGSVINSVHTDITTMNDNYEKLKERHDQFIRASLVVGI